MNLINKLMDKIKTTSPKGGKRGCLCEDGTYSSDCCNGELQEQGIGAFLGAAFRAQGSSVRCIKN